MVEQVKLTKEFRRFRLQCPSEGIVSEGFWSVAKGCVRLAKRTKVVRRSENFFDTPSIETCLALIAK